MEEGSHGLINGHGAFVNGHRDEVDHEESIGGKGRLVDESLACRYLAAQCLVGTYLLSEGNEARADGEQVQQEKYHQALELLGESNPFKEAGAQITLAKACSLTDCDQGRQKGSNQVKTTVSRSAEPIMAPIYQAETCSYIPQYVISAHYYIFVYHHWHWQKRASWRRCY